MTAPKRLQMSNAQVEDRAIAYVLAHEKAAGRDATDMRRAGGPVDIESIEPATERRRLIEVKAFRGAGRGGFLWLEDTQVQALDNNPAGHVYIVTHLRSEDPADVRLLDLTGVELQARLDARRPKSYVEIPMPVAVYDALAERAARPREGGS